MPSLRPPDPSGYHSHNQPGARPPLPEHKKAIRHQKKSRASAIRQEVDRIESTYWHHRLINYSKSKINRWINPPASVEIQDLVNAPTKKGLKRKPEIVIAALNLHTGSDIPLNPIKNRRISGNIAIETKTIEAVANSVELNGVELAYEYLHKGKNLPAGYLQQILFPHLSRQVLKAIKELKARNIPLTPTQLTAQLPENAKKSIERLAKKVKLVDEQSFSFERMLELKKEIRNTIVKSINEQKSLRTQQPVQQHNTATSQPPFTHPKLDIPKATDHFIEKEDTDYIKKTASQDRFFSKIHLKDLTNRAKRVFLRNKRNHIFLGLVVTVGILMSVFFPPAGLTIGMAVAVSLTSTFSHIVFWTGGSTLWRRYRLGKGLKQIKKYADFDYTSLDKKDDQKRKDLIKKLLYQCKHKNLTALYNWAGNLEKRKQKLMEMVKKPQITLAESVALEKERALYEEEHRKLHSNLLFFDLLKENIIIHQKILEHRYINDLRELWQEKFANMSSKDRDDIFKKASRDKRLFIRGKQIKIESQSWVRNIIPASLSNKTPVRKSRKPAESPLENIKVSGSNKSLAILSQLAQEFLFKQVKNLFFANLSNVFKIVGRSIQSVPVVIPKITTTGTSFFVAFFFLDIASSHLNSKQNKRRMKEVKAGKKGLTRQLFGMREKTGREEIATVRAMAKSEVEPMVDHILESIKEMEKTGKNLDDARERSKALGKGRFGAMTHEDAAITILTYSAWQQLIGQQIDGAFNQFRQLVLKKVSRWDQQLTARWLANGRQAMSVATLPQEKTHNHLPHLKSKKSDHVNPPILSGGMVQRALSDIVLNKIKDRKSGQLIRNLLIGKLPKDKVASAIHSLQDSEELRLLQLWISYALEEDGYKKHKATLKKLDQIVAGVIHQKGISFPGTQPSMDRRRPIGPA